MLNLLIFGPPGAGKGTQASLLAKKYTLNHLSSGELLRQERENGPLGVKIKKYQDAGQLVPDSLIIKMIEEAIKKDLNGNGFIFDGYPRNLHQAKALDRFLKTLGKNIQIVLNLKLNSKTATERILLRSKTSGRSDDNKKIIASRLQVYRQQTTPLLEYYKTQNKLKNIDGSPAIKSVFQQISEIIKNRFSPFRKKAAANE